MPLKKYRAPLFNPNSDKPFRISRTKIELFLRCPFCFYLNQRHGVRVPDGPPFVINIRIDALLKKDADINRELQRPDPRAKKLGIKAIPFNHPEIKHWLNVYNDVGLEYLHQETNLTVFGAPDDIWLVNGSELSTVDVKATHSNKPITESYFWEENKRQTELYSWLLNQQGLFYPVSETSYFIRINTNKNQQNFNNNCIEFEDEVIPYIGSHVWIEPTLVALKVCLMQNKLPDSNPKCGFCQYRSEVRKIEKQN